MDDLADRFNDWLRERYEPDRTAKGRIRRRKGVHVYGREVHDELRRLLGGSYTPQAIRRARAGDDVGIQLKAAIKTLVELEDREAILAHRRDERLATALRHGRRHHDRSGKAPDGGDLEAWARRQRRELDDHFDTDAPLGGEAAELWEEICVPRINRIRRQRRAA